MRTFTFNGVDSSTYGVYVKASPEIESGAVRSKTQTILGSAKVLHFTEGMDAMDPIRIRLECVVPNPTQVDITQLAAWLRGGGNLILPDDTGHFYKAWITAPVTTSRLFRTQQGRELDVEFECEAHRYIFPEAAAAAISTGMVYNSGTAPAKPLFKLTGNGDATFMVGSSSLMIDGIDGYVYVDCDTQMIYKGDVNMGASVTRIGDWPEIPPEGCAVNWTQEITAVEMTPRWRDY